MLQIILNTATICKRSKIRMKRRFFASEVTDFHISSTGWLKLKLRIWKDRSGMKQNSFHGKTMKNIDKSINVVS